MNPEPRLCTVCFTSRCGRIWPPKKLLKKSSRGSRTVRRTTRSVLMFTTAGIAFATASTEGSCAGSFCGNAGAQSPAKIAAKLNRAVMRRWGIKVRDAI